MENRKLNESTNVTEIEDDASLDQCLLHLCDELTNLRNSVSENLKKKCSFVEEKRRVNEELEALRQKYDSVEKEGAELKDGLTKAFVDISNVLPLLRNAAKGYKTMREINALLKQKLKRAIRNHETLEVYNKVLSKEKCVMRAEMDSLGAKLSNERMEADELKKVVNKLEEDVSRLNKEKEYYVKRNTRLMTSIGTQKEDSLKQMQDSVSYLEMTLSSALQAIPHFKSEIGKMLGQDRQLFSERDSSQLSLEGNHSELVLESVQRVKLGTEKATGQESQLYSEERDSQFSSNGKSTQLLLRKKFPQSLSEMKYERNTPSLSECESRDGDESSDAYSPPGNTATKADRSFAPRTSYLSNVGATNWRDTKSHEEYAALRHYVADNYQEIMSAVDEQKSLVQHLDSFLMKKRQMIDYAEAPCSLENPDNDN